MSLHLGPIKTARAFKQVVQEIEQDACLRARVKEGCLDLLQAAADPTLPDERRLWCAKTHSILKVAFVRFSISERHAAMDPRQAIRALQSVGVLANVEKINARDHNHTVVLQLQEFKLLLGPAH